jgi:hypothetical protein
VYLPNELLRSWRRATPHSLTPSLPHSLPSPPHLPHSLFNYTLCRPRLHPLQSHLRRAQSPQNPLRNHFSVLPQALLPALTQLPSSLLLLHKPRSLLLVTFFLLLFTPYLSLDLSLSLSFSPSSLRNFLQVFCYCTSRSLSFW